MLIQSPRESIIADEKLKDKLFKKISGLEIKPYVE